MKSLLSDNSIMDVIVNAAIPDKDGNDRHLPDGFRLPELEDEKLARFADGAIDGIFIYHTEHQTISDEARELLVKAIALRNWGQRRAPFPLLTTCSNTSSITKSRFPRRTS